MLDGVIEQLIDTIGDPALLALGGAITGLLFGATAQHSQFCLRAATAEVAQFRIGPKLGIWLVSFATAVLVVQTLISHEWLNVSGARQLAAVGSISGAVIGGLLFGAGMILARGCASRLLVLSGTGNLRALITGLVLTLVAQASYKGILSPARETLAGLWLVEGGASRDLIQFLGMSWHAMMFVAALMLIVGFGLLLHKRIPLTQSLAAVGVGLAVALGWWITHAIASVSFEPVSIGSVTFTGPSTDTLMGFINAPDLLLTFSIGLVPAVFVGSGLMAVMTKSFKVQQFDGSVRLERYLAGACLMGFGAMLAGGCAVGAGVTGGSIMASTAWLALAAMWAGAMMTQWLLEWLERRHAATEASDLDASYSSPVE